MSSDQIQRRRKESEAFTDFLAGRAWVKLDLEFWHRCVIVFDNGPFVTVALGNLDEFTVDRDCVRQFELAAGDIVFVQQLDWGLGGTAAIVVSAKDEVAEVNFNLSMDGEGDHGKVVFRDLRAYDGVPLSAWRKGSRVFAYQASRTFYPRLFLFFQAVVREIIHDVCVVVEFVDGESTIVPITLLEKPELKPGSFVHACTSYDHWSVCRIIERESDVLTLRDGAGEEFESLIEMIGILPKGFRMIDGKFEKISDDEPATTTVHIIRAERWQDAATEPITKEDVDALIAKDPELAWEKYDQITASVRTRVPNRPFTIVWRGESCFWWQRHAIRSESPNETHLAKMIDMAIELDANVVGGDGTEYH